MCKFSKFTLGALVASSITSSACANWYDGVFVGAEANYNIKSKLKAHYNVQITNAVGDFDTDNGQFGLGLKVGYDLDFMRVYGAINHNFEAKSDSAISAYSSFDEKPKWSGNDFILGADWTPKFSLGGVDFKGILGAYGGLSYLDLKYNAVNNAPGGDTFKFDSSLDGFVYGAKFGAIYELNKMGEVEFGFKFDNAKYGNENLSFVVCNYGNCTTINGMEVSNAKRTNLGLFVGYNYKF